MGITYNPRTVTDGLVLALDAANPKSYPGSGEIWYDLSGRGNNATRTNNGGYGGQVTYNSSGHFDFSMNSPASTAGATAGNGFTMSSMIIPSTGNFTLSAFIRRNLSVKAAGDRETIFSNAGGADGWRFGILDTGALYYLISGANAVGFQEGGLGGNTLNNGNWHMATIVFDRAISYKVYGYIDGVPSGEVSISAGAAGNVAFSNSFPGVGYSGCCDVFAGQISQVLAYNKSLSSSEVQQNFNALRGRYGI